MGLRKGSDFESEKDLVAEQPGLGLSFMGLFLAFFMGIAIRAAISPDRVQEHLHRATEKIHKDLHISFGHAYVSLADGIFPDLSVVIEDVKISSDKACWLTPLAEINEVRLPLSMGHLFRGEILIHEVLADEFNLSLRNPYAKCENDGAAALADPALSHSARATASNLSGALSLPPSKPVIADFQNVRRSNPIDSVEIKHFNIHYMPIAFTSFFIENFSAKLKSQDPKWIQLMGKLILNRDVDALDTSAHANLQLDFHEGTEPNLDLLLQGVWREGHFNLKSHLDIKAQDLSLQSEVRHMPLSQIIPYLKKYRLMESEFNGKRAWVSGEMKVQGGLSKLQQTPMRFDRLKLEGDLGEISCSVAEITSLAPFTFNPIDLQIRGLNIRELLIFLNRPHPTPALGELGIFNGTAHFVNPEQLALRGDYSGLEFIFSNRGSRQTQALSLISGELELKKNTWEIQVDRVKPVEGIFDGKLKMTADKDFKNLAIDAQIAELGLAPKIQSLMTGGGSLGALSGQLKLKLKEAQITELNGLLKWNQLLIEGVRLQKPKISLKMQAQDLRMDINAAELDITPKENNTLFAGLFESLGTNTLQLQSASTQIRTRQFKSLSWEKFQAQSSYGTFRSQGGWNENSELNGKLQIRGKNAKSEKLWKIQGTRNQPQFTAQSHD